MDKPNSEFEPWYKQFWPWLVISIPLLTVVAGVLTFIIAHDKPHSMVKDDYFKEGLAINQSIEKQQRAKDLKISAELFANKPQALLEIKLQSNEKLPKQLKVVFSHPTQSKNDVSVILDEIISGEFVGTLPALGDAHWYIRISDQKDTWLIKSRWRITESDRHLAQ